MQQRSCRAVTAAPPKQWRPSGACLRTRSWRSLLHTTSQVGLHIRYCTAFAAVMKLSLVCTRAIVSIDTDTARTGTQMHVVGICRQQQQQLCH